MIGFLSGIGTLLARVTTARAGFLDALNIGAGKTVPNGTDDWTTARAAKIDNLNAAMDTRAPAATALSNANWPNSLASTLGTLRKVPQVKLAANCLAESVVTGLYGDAFLPFNYATVAIADKNNGYRVYSISSNASGVYQDIINVAGSGWVVGILGIHSGVSGLAKVGLKTLVDGLTVNETSYENRNPGDGKIVLGIKGSDGTNAYAVLSPVGMRYESTLQVQLKADNSVVKGRVIILPD